MPPLGSPAPVIWTLKLFLAFDLGQSLQVFYKHCVFFFFLPFLEQLVLG